MKAYLDNNATTQIAPEVKEAIDPYLMDYYANPSSLYESGQLVRRRIEEARENIARFLGVRGRELIFTSGGTESNNTAVRSALKCFPTKKKIVTTQVEHSSIKNLCDALAKEGYQIHSVGVSKNGSLDWNDFIKSLDVDVAVVSVMWANNETGVLFPIREIGEALKSRKILFHVDAVQAVGKIPIDLNEIYVDYLSFSTHKIHGPKGIGGLYVQEGSLFQPLIVGGRQERDRRAGTENVAGIIGFERALELTASNDSKKISDLRDHFETQLTALVSESFINGKNEARIPNTTNITIPGIEAESFLIRLSESRIEASSGSACLTGALEPSHVLMAMGLAEELASASLRFSLSRFTTNDEINYALNVIPKLVDELRVTAGK